jgi:DNA-binding transcriptional MerR regulator
MESYQPGEVSKMLDIPGSTLRRYVATFPDYLTPGAKRQRGRRFTDRDIAILARVRDLAGRGVQLADIPAQLGDVLEEEEPTQNQTVALALPGVVKSLAEIQRLFQDQQTELNELRQAQAELLEYIKLPWWERIRRKPPGG